MQKIIPFFLLSLYALFFDMPNNEGARVSGTVKNSKQGYITLNYSPRLRGNINFDNFSSIGAAVNSKGTFVMKADIITDGAEYSIETDVKALKLVLFKGDDIHVAYDNNDRYNTMFATGIGAGKVNVLYLNQFKFKSYPDTITLAEFSARADSIVSARMQLLDALYSKQSAATAIAGAANEDRLIRIIKQSPLSKREYDFLKTVILSEKYTISGFIAHNAESKNIANTKVDFNDTALREFNKNNYGNIAFTNYWLIETAVDNILKAEYMKAVLQQKPDVTYKDWNRYVSTASFSKWSYGYLKNNFQPEVHDAYCAGLSAFLMTLGHFDEELYNHIIDAASLPKYSERLAFFKKHIDNGLADEKYGLASDRHTLNEDGINTLLEKYKGKNVLVVFWSAQFAGASVIDNLPSISNFAKQNNIKVVSICIDKEAYKNLWAARIIDSSWKGEHYFLPVENNTLALNKFSSEKISEFCNGGVTYSLLNSQGTIYNKVQNPASLTKEKLTEYFK